MFDERAFEEGYFIERERDAFYMVEVESTEEYEILKKHLELFRKYKAEERGTQ